MEDLKNDYKSFLEDIEKRIEKLEKTQKELDEKMEKMQQVINNIEKDIYSEEGFDFEIVCPYCNYEFIIDMDENKSEIECPECQNIIELDWSGDLEHDEDEGCTGSCGGCHGCHDEDDDM